MEGRVKMTFYIDNDLANELKDFAYEMFGNFKSVSDAVNILLREGLKSYRNKQNKKLCKNKISINKKLLKVIKWLYDTYLSNKESELDSVWISWDIIQKYIMISLGIISRTSINEYYKFFKSIAYDYKEVRRGRYVIKQLLLNKGEVERLLRRYGYDIPGSDEKPRKKIRLTKTYEIEVSGSTSDEDLDELKLLDMC